MMEANAPDSQLFITVDELEKTFSNIVVSLRQKTDRIIVSDDHYWTQLESQECYDMEFEPKTFRIGQISEDLHFLKHAILEDILLDTYLLSKILPILRNYADRNYGAEEPKK